MGRPVEAERLYALGAVNAVVPTGEAEAEAMQIATRLARGPRMAQGVIRDLVNAAYEQGEMDQLYGERGAMAEAQGGDESAEGIAAFLEKRRPNFG